MDPLERGRPEDYLKDLEQEETRRKKGQLKIFLGMAAGVGKTFAMLTEAQMLKEEGVEVLVGVVETHGREETAHLLKGLTVVPEKIISYKGKDFKEVDVDTIIALKPEIILIDELAHTNTPGSKHTKRWQDVVDILDHGINVYTTLNVQHIESLNDIINEITGINVRETVPDLVIEKAATIQLIDLTPDELLQRLREGKVYLGEKSQIAIEHFFQEDRLIALRAIVLRYAADKIDSDLRKKIHKIDIIEWKPREIILVAISERASSQKLIRSARRLAAHLDSLWIALHVNNGAILNDKEIDQLSKNLALARDLGGEVVTINDPDIAAGIKRVVNQRNVTQVIIGKSPSTPFFSIFKRLTLVDKLAAECKNIDFHLIGEEKHPKFSRKKISGGAFHKNISDYLIAFLWICAFTIFGWLSLPIIGYKVVGAVFLIGILMLSLFFKKGPVIFASIVYGLIWYFFFIPPEGKHGIVSYEDEALISLYVLTALTIGTLIDRAREQNEMLQKSEKRTFALYEIVRHLAGNITTEEMVKFVKGSLSKFLEGSYDILVKKIDDGLMIRGNEQLLSDTKEKSVALWSFENGEEAGWSTETLPYAQNLYLPLKQLDQINGLLIFRPKIKKTITVEEKNFLYTVCQQLSNFIERSFAVEKEKMLTKLKHEEAIQRNILNQFYATFSRPITITKMAIEDLKSKMEKEEKKEKFSQEIVNVENSFDVFTKSLSNMTIIIQLSEGMIPLRKSRHLIPELFEEYFGKGRRSLDTHPISLIIDDKLPPVSFDEYLMQILIHNLMINAAEHSPAGSKIIVEAKKSDGFLILSVADEGKGIPNDQLENIFEKFYRIPDGFSAGIGLGLSIAKTIAEIHHGTLKAENLPEKGARFSLTMPID